MVSFLIYFEKERKINEGVAHREEVFPVVRQGGFQSATLTLLDVLPTSPLGRSGA